MGQKPSAVAELEPPVFDDEVWMANCCKVNSMSRFAEFLGRIWVLTWKTATASCKKATNSLSLLRFCLYQPDCRRFCDKGIECKYLRKRTSGGSWADLVPRLATALQAFCVLRNQLIFFCLLKKLHLIKCGRKQTLKSWTIKCHLLSFAIAIIDIMSSEDKEKLLHGA